MKIHIRKHKLPEGSKLFNLIVCNYIIANNALYASIQYLNVNLIYYWQQF